MCLSWVESATVGDCDGDICCSSIVSTSMGKIVGVDGVGTEEESSPFTDIVKRVGVEDDDACALLVTGSGVGLSLSFFMEIRAIRPTQCSKTCVCVGARTTTQ